MNNGTQGPDLCFPEDPLERLDPSAQLVLRDHEDPKIGRAALDELTTELHEPRLDRFYILHVDAMRESRVIVSPGEVYETIRSRGRLRRLFVDEL
jgi:hypothetical protein